MLQNDFGPWCEENFFKAFEAARVREHRRRKRRGQQLVSICFDGCEIDRLHELGYFDGVATPAQAVEAYLPDSFSAKFALQTLAESMSKYP